MLTLWMDVAFVDHQYDLSPAQHHEHHCQLFSCAQHGASAATVSTPDSSLPDLFIKGEEYQCSTINAFAYQARSPPNHLNT
ncbi:DUF2607 domain-containing protein [Vibrio japonicus]|uniref:DUF2607 domain-containing protein n=1 Tax=Vibrio japonicus TaxID=1824638 RepID=A0ABY5LFR9_9VIBR|nr:DUF2607 domain-containing protein [Vibrio japonicus]UUM30879.1 DUF2607 domain-containing protein [Vibrio japonicus]